MKAERRRIELTKLFNESEISARVEELARAAAPCLPGNFVVVGLLLGSFVFVADLLRAFYRIGCNPSVEFMRLNSYGMGRESSGNVRLQASSILTCALLDKPSRRELPIEVDF